jgi:hypothetical protein
MSEDVNQNRKSVVINYRDLFNLYLKNKYNLLIDDLVLFMQSYEGINQYKYNPSSKGYFSKFVPEYIKSKCSNQGSNIPNTSVYNYEWYNVSSTELSQRLYGTWFNGEEYKTYDSLLQEDKERIINLCALNEVLSRFLSKHIRWLDFLGSTVEYWSFSFSSSLFYKFPVYYNSYMQPNWTDPFIKASCQTSRKIVNQYDPKCRPFYNETLIDSSNIVITKPYKYVTTLYYGSDICIKSLSKSQVIQYGKALPDLMTCIGFNFNDVQIYRNQIENSLGANKRVFIVYYAENEINVLFNSEYNPPNYVSWGKYFNINNNDENNFFEAYIQDSMITAISDVQSSNDTLKKVYPEMKDFYEKNISGKLINMIKNYQNPNLNYSNINITNYRDFNESAYYFTLNQAYEYSNSSSNLFLSSGIYQNFYLFPVPVSFDYTGNYLLKVSQNSNFYIIFIDEQHQKYENVSLFFSIISFEIFLYFFFLVGINTLIWVIFGLIYYYFFKGFFMPLNEINHTYKDLLLRDDDMLPRGNLPSNGSFNSGKKYSNLIEKFITKWVSAIFRLNEYQEIHDCLITLRILKIIRTFSEVSTKSLKLNYDLGRRETHLENIVDAFLYLMHEISPIYLENPNIDINLVVSIIQNNFIYRINSTDDREEVEVFYEDITCIVDHVLNKKNSRRLSNAIRRSSSLRMSLKSSTNLLTKEEYPGSPIKDSQRNMKRSSISAYEFEKELKSCFSKLKEDLQYKYCIFKMKNLDNKLSNNHFNEDYLDCEYNSDEENSNNKNWGNYINYDEEYSLLNKNNFTRNRNQETVNQTNYKKKEKLQLEEDILSIVNEFNRYFVITNEEDSENSFNSLKHIAAYITQASLLFQINNETHGIRQCILAMEKIKSLQQKIINLGKMTKFAYLIICTLLFERILYLLANLSEKCDQKKTQFFIYLNMLDLGPVYDRKIRANILQKLLDYLNRSGLDFQKLAKISPFEQFDKEDGFLNTKLVRHKVRALLNISITYPKSVLLLFDLNVPFLKDSNFQKILINAIMKDKHFFYFSCFDEKLYIYRNKNNLGEVDQSEIFKSDDELEIINILSNDESIQILSENNETILNDCNTPYEFFEFINNYKRLDNNNNNYFNQPRLDLSITNVLKFYNFKEYPKNNNFLIVLTSIDAAFSFNRDNLIRISQTLYDTQYSLILCILNDERIYTQEKYQRKLQCYKKFIEENIINGHLFILKSFSLLKYIINCISPNKLKEFDVLTMKTFLESIDLNFVEKNENMKREDL